MVRTLRWTLMLCTLLLAAPLAGAADYYLDSEAGSDEAAGTSPQQAWASLERLAQVTLQPGDRALLRRGSTFRGRLRITGSGTERAPVTVGAWGEGDRPEILGTVQLEGWAQAEGEVWQATVPEELFFGKNDLFSVYEYDDAIPVRLERTDEIPTERGTYHFDPETLTLSAITTDGRSPAEHRFEVPVIEQLVALRDQRWLVFEDLALLMGNCRHVVMSGCEDVIWRDCASLFVGAYGNPNFILREGCRNVEILNCFLYENVNGGVLLTSGTTQCRVAGCTIERCRSNDGITCHAGPRVDGVRTGLTGDGNIIENNVIGHCPEESIDITSGDYHVLRGNICHDDGNPGIIVGHDSDHILIENNICLRNRTGIQIAGTGEEGARGHNRVINNLCYENSYPGLEMWDSPDNVVLNNTFINSHDRVLVRFHPECERPVLKNNIIANLAPTIPHRLIHFLRCTPESVDAELSDNLLFHAADVRKREVFFPAGELIRTDDGSYTVDGFRERYDTGAGMTVADPGFGAMEDGYFRLSDGAISGVGADSDALPQYPPHLLDGSKRDRAEILRLWDKNG
jgi:parallel beta-helix repeat protein